MGQARIFKLLAAGTLAAVLMTATAAAFTDTAGHWAENAIDKWSGDYHILNGYGDGSFQPDEPVTRGAFAGIMNRFLRFRDRAPADTFYDLQEGNSWFDEILRLNAAGVYLGNEGMAYAGERLTRQQAVAMIARAFQIADGSGYLPYYDTASFEEYAIGPVSAMSALGYLDGVDSDAFRPIDPITRAEIVKIFDNLVEALVQTDTPWTWNVDGNLMVNSEYGAAVRGVSVSGDLILAPGAGPVLLEDVSYTGQLRNLSAMDPTIVHTPSPTPTPEPTPEPSPTPTPEPTPVDEEPVPTATPEPTPTPLDPEDADAPFRRPTPTPIPTATPTPTPSPTPTPTPTPPYWHPNAPTMTPTPAPSATPEPTPTAPADNTDLSNFDPEDADAPFRRPTPLPTVPGGYPMDPEDEIRPTPTPTPLPLPPEPTPTPEPTPYEEEYIPGPIDWNSIPWLSPSDIYTPSPTSGSFTYNGSRVPIYLNVKTRNVFSGDFAWSGSRMRYTGNRYDVTFGVDVSAYQNRERSRYNYTINFNAAKQAGVDFAIIRVGLRGTSTGNLLEDGYFGRNIDGAMAAGLTTGAYVFSQAITLEEALEEADFVIDRLRGHTINGPVCYDWETGPNYRVNNLSKEMATACALVFCQRVAEAGYTPLVYQARDVCYFKYDQGAIAPYLTWYPQYPATSTTDPYPNVYYQMDLWQFSDKCTISGIGTNIDGNLWFHEK